MTPTDEPTIDALLANQPLVRRIARDLLDDPHSRDDVVQQTWIAALRHAGRGNVVGPTLLGRIAQRLAFNRLRDTRRRRKYEAFARMHEPLPAPAEILAAEDLRRRVVEAVLALGDPLRSTVLLRYLREHSEAEVAERMAVPLETVRSRLKKARSILRDRLSGDDPHPTARGLVALAGMTPESVGAAVAKGAIVSGANAWIGAAAAVVVAAFAWHEFRPDASTTDARDAGARTRANSASEHAQADPVLDVRAVRAAVAVDEVARGVASTPRAEIRGRCVTPEGEPIEGATITTKAIPTWPTTTSDAAGRFAVVFDAPVLAPQNEAIDCNVVASASGRASVAKPIRLQRAAVSELGCFVLALGGEVRGIVLSADDRPLRATVWVHSGRLTSEEIAVGLTNEEPHVSAGSDGRFAFTGLAEGWYSVFATDPDAVCDAAVPVGVVAGTTAEACVRMRPMTSSERIRGRVLDANGQSVDPAELRWVSIVMSPSGVRMATHFLPVNHGEFSCRGGAAESSFTATFADGSTASVSGVKGGAAEVILREPPAAVDGSADLGAVLQNAELTGTVDGVDDPHGEIRVVMRGIDRAHEFDEWSGLLAQRWMVVGSSTAGERGEFALSVHQGKPSPTRLVLRAECPGYAPTQIEVPQERLASPEPFGLTLIRGGTIAGNVAAPGLASAAGLAVLASNADGDCTSTHVTEDGTYLLENLRAGGWHVAIREEDRSRRLPATRSPDSPPNAIVTNGETTKLDIVFETPPPVIVTGVIRIGDASTYDLSVSLVEAESRAGGRVGALNRMDRSGRLGGIQGRVLPSGSFRIDGAKPGNYVLNISRGLEVVSMTLSRPVTLSVGANPVDVIIDCGIVSGTCKFEPLPTRVGGIAVSGELASRTTVQLNTACLPDGSFQIPLVPAGSLTIAADTVRQTIEVRAGATTEVELARP